ncbi:MAG: Glucose-6-phosphate isomerase [Phycisphaerales bacterium]|nr:Glucose-6-phosphate isomerase [Phycisphaerales bacterium]MDB5354478.1 Glucose-6-phosphate isomerase [Phycisphaerales bacterium]
MDRLGLYWKNATVDAVGEKHGISDNDLKQIAPRLKSLVKQAAEDRKAGKLPFRELPYDEDAVDAVNREVEHFRDRCDTLIVLATGSAATGCAALQDALNPSTYNLMSDRVRTGPQLFVIDGADPDDLKAIGDLVAPRLKKAILNVISEPGGSVETAAEFFYFRELLQGKLGKKYGDNILAISGGSDGILQQIAAAEGYRGLTMPQGVSGPLSLLSSAGLFSAAMCGTDIEALLEGAREMDKRCKDPDPLANPAAMAAAIHYLLTVKGRTVATMMPNAAALGSLADWFGQLWPRSAGRITDLKIVEDQFVTFLEVERFGQKLTIPPGPGDAAGMEYLSGSNFQALVHAQKMAAEHVLREGGRPTMSLVFPTISPQTIGQFVYLYEVAAEFLASLMGLNVEDGAAKAGQNEAAIALLGAPESAELAKKMHSSGKRDPKFLL